MNILDSNLSRRAWLRESSLAAASASALSWPAFAQTAPAEFVEAVTTYGRVRGEKTTGHCVFRGIPYAGSVSGARRFKTAAPLQSWTGVRDALKPGAPSPQPGRTAGRGNEPAPAEDCLFLNVWTPAADNRKRPVMIYNHGGGFTSGSGSSSYQDAGNLAQTFDVVVVATNHRLGLVGYLYLAELGGEEYADSGNQGMLDIRDGLKWVHDNIGNFGGDASNVMLFGESGGGMKTSCLYAMPSAEAYFNKASIESGPGIRMTPKDVAAETTLMVLEKLGIATQDWRNILDVPLDQLLAAQSGVGAGRGAGGAQTQMGGVRGMSNSSRPGAFGPVVDGKILPAHPFDPVAPAISKNKPLIVGSNHDEALFFLRADASVFSLTDEGLKARAAADFGDKADAMLAAYRKSRPDASPSDLYIALTTARMIGVGATTIAERKSEQHGAPAYLYIFSHKSPEAGGVPHGSEIPYKFYDLRSDTRPARPTAQPAAQQGGAQTGRAVSGVGYGPLYVPEDTKAAHNMAELWSTFARTGRPAAKGQPDWPAYTVSKRSVMEIDTECKVVNDPLGIERAAWARLNP